MYNKIINFEADEIVSKYFKDIKKRNIISQDEEIELSKKIKNGDLNALNKLVSSNLKFVVTIAKEYQGNGLTLSDLISEGNYGLIKAAKKFDHTKGFRFISYAVWWVRQSILYSLNENARVVRLPISVLMKLTQLNKEIDNNKLSDSNLEMSSDDNSFLLHNTHKQISLNDFINDDGDEYHELMCDNFNDEKAIVIDEKIKNKINYILSLLSEKERIIIQCYFGLNTECEPMTLEAIGEKLGLTKERVRQIKEKTLKKIREHSSELFDIVKG